jgi:DNA modification methylase
VNAPVRIDDTQAALAAYREFLRGKIVMAESHGFEVDPGEINPNLKDFVRQAIVPWAAAGGRRAIFSSFGLHKTSVQLELARLAMKNTGVAALQIVPLGVRQEFFEEAALRFTGDHAIKLKFIRRMNEVDETAINITNYETAREGHIDPKVFGFLSLDEAACLRGFGGTKTFREFMAMFAGDDRKNGIKSAGVRFRYVATATPDPNEFIELLAYAAFLGIMDVGQAKTRFFKRDSEHADKLTIHPHKVQEFWLWVASWALFVRRPSDLGFSDEGYNMPALDVRWHEVPSDHRAAGAERDGQVRMFKNAAFGVSDAAKEKRESLPARIEALQCIRAEDPDAHRIIWHDLEAEREAIEDAISDVVSIYGSQALETNEKNALDFKHGRIRELATKPSMSGAGCNFQAHCHRAVFLGIGHKFHDFIQAVHRLQRFGQQHEVSLDLIYSEAERETRRNLEAKWKRHEQQAEIMSAIIREYGLSQAALASTLQRSFGVVRAEIAGDNYRLINNDCVEEAHALETSSVHLIVTSIPFSTQYEYTPSYNDFGHTDDDAHFWAQMDFLTPQLHRALQPGRVAAIHVKDRIVPGGINGFGFQTVSPFSDQCVAHFVRHGFAFLARKTICTDVVRENNQTYRLGWTEQCKDGSRMGAGMPEYLLLFRKPPSDASNGYADVPVRKDKREWKRDHWTNDGYSRARWQIDAHGFQRSSGERLLTGEELIGLPADVIYKTFRKFSAEQVYDFERHVRIAEALESKGQLPPTFMLVPPASWHPDVWSDVTRMRTLNGAQHAKGREMHLCPLQFDIVDRAIAQFTMPGETVLDPFGGLMTVPYRALLLKRRGIGIELSGAYFRDGAVYCEAAERQMAMPSLFDFEGAAAGERALEAAE